MKIQKIFFLGDTHGEWGPTNIWINKNIRNNKSIQNYINEGHDVEIIVLQVGDFGWWPHKHGVLGFDGNPKKPWNQYGIKNKMDGIRDNTIKFYFAPGNHENHDSLREIEESTDEKFIEIIPGVFFCTFGSVLTLLNGTNVMFCGGADSIDKDWRIPGDSWWANEIISYADMYKLPDPNDIKIDWIISHTCPISFKYYLDLKFTSKMEDPSTEYLENIFKMFNPSKWWFGHFHKYINMKHFGCEFTCLDMISGQTKKSDSFEIKI